jgi:hypothetical protein
VASHSIFGFVARMISILLSDFWILLNNQLKSKSATKIQFTGDIAHHNI